MCGDLHFAWNHLRMALDHAHLIEKYHPTNHSDLENEIHHLAADYIQLDELRQLQGWNVTARKIKHPTMSKEAGSRIDSLLWAFRTRQSTMEHDRLYALLNLANEMIPIIPDYTKSPEMVYCELAKALILREPNPTFPLDHIGFSHSPNNNRRETLPSWAPDWHPSAHHVQLLATYDPWISPYRADDNLLDHFPTLLRNSMISKPRELKQLEIIAIKLGVLHVLGRKSPTGSFKLREWNSLAKEWAALAPDCSADDFLRVLLCDRHEDRRTRLPTDTAANLAGWFGGKGKDIFPPNTFKIIARLTRGWKFGRTTEKHSVLVPSNTEKDDIICVPIGSSTPFVLRSTEKRDVTGIMQYQLIGRCYVHGFMDGEAMLGVRATLKKAEQDRVSILQQEMSFLSQLESFILV